MRVHVDDDQCAGHSVCWSLCPEVFAISDAGYAITVVTEVPTEHEAAVRTAADRCPERAISVSE